MTSDRTFKLFLKIVCTHLNIINPQEVIANFLDFDNIRNRTLLQRLFDVSSRSPIDVYNTPFGLIFYKTSENYEKTFAIPIANGVPVLQKSVDHTGAGSNPDDLQSTQSDNDAYVVLGVADGDIDQRLSGSLDTDMMKQRDSSASVQSTGEGENETSVTGNGSTQQFLFITRTFTRECLKVQKLPIYDSFTETYNITQYFYVVRTNRARAIPNVKSYAEVMQHFPVSLNIGYLQDTMLNCTLRTISKVYTKMLSYFGHKRDMFSEDDALDSRAANFSPSSGKKSVMDHHSSSRVNNKHSSFLNEQEDYQRLRDEFSVTLHKFNGVLEETSVALLGVFNLTIPDFMPDNDNYVIDPTRDFIFNDKLIQLFKEWDEQIDGALEILDKPRPISLGPLDEVDHWRYRSKILTAISESLNTKQSRWAIDTWSILNPDLQPYTRGAEIKSLMFEAKDNSR
ncbi:unnamed protein product [Trichobilharzia szidati]|nr:unnamed protein product [Trichobilharzia szidati]